MKSMILVALALVAVAAAAPVEQPTPQILILRSNNEQQPDGAYVFGFETENGINQQETGELKEAADEEGKLHKVIIVRGSYSYPGEDGKPVVVNYYADQDGFHAEGETIPKPATR